jgi:chemotaxis response regulator CheB
MVFQDPATAESAVLPHSAIQEGIVDRIYSLTEMSRFLARLSET